MSKPQGSTRMLKPTKAAISQSKKEYNSQLVLTTTDAGNSYFSEKSGGYLIAMKGHNLSSLEAEAGKYLADFGLQVHLTPEGAGHEIYATHSYVKDGKTHYKFPEGKINMFTFEQKAPSKIESSIERSVRQAILHANSKHADIAVIYDKHNLFDRNDIENGMKLYQSKFKKWETKGVKAVIAISHDGGVFEHQFDK